MSLLLKSCVSLGALFGRCSEPCASSWDEWYGSSSRFMTEEEGQAMSTRDEARRRRNILATTMTKVMEEKISRDLEERWRCADVVMAVALRRWSPCVWGRWAIVSCRGDVQHRVVLTCDTCKTLVCTTCCRWEKARKRREARPRTTKTARCFLPSAGGPGRYTNTGHMKPANVFVLLGVSSVKGG